MPAVNQPPTVASRRTAPRAALAVGSLAMGAFAIGAIALGAFAIGRLTVRKARFGILEIDRLIVRDLELPRARVAAGRD